MIRHVVLLKWNEGVDDTHIAATKAALDRLPGLISQIVSFENGPDLRAVPGTWDYAVSADFASTDDFMMYRDHPDHQKFVKAHLTDYCQRLAVQFSLG